jgi:glutaredoxin
VKIYLYSTLGCHLCEQAKVILWPLLLKYQFRLAEIDISASDEMIENYGTRIPVLSVGDNSSELNWPFTPEQVDSYFAELAGG